MAMRIQVLEVRLGDGSLGFGRQWKEAQKEEKQSIMISLGVSRIHFQCNSWLWKKPCSRFPAYEKSTGMDDDCQSVSV
jgi:hypothetical protein